MVGDAHVAPQDPAQEIPLRRAGHFGGADSFAGVGCCKLSLKKILLFFLESNIFCIFAIGKIINDICIIFDVYISKFRFYTYYIMHNKYVFDPYPLSQTMQRLAENLRARRLEKKLSTKSLAAMSGVPASTIQRFELKHAISLESYVRLAKALGYSEEMMQLLSEPKYDTMEELLEINKNKTRKRGV